MKKIEKTLLTTAIVVFVLGVGYLVAASWQAANILESTLRVGAPTAQSSGWPEPTSPADIGYVGDPKQAYGYTFQEVTLSNGLGDMPAWLIPAEEPNTAWAIFVHGIGGRRENGYRFLPTLRNAGFPVLMVNYRNDSGTPADPSGLYAFGLTEWQDLDTAVRYATDNGAESVILVAESMGGGIVGQFLRHSKAASAISAIVLDAPAIDFQVILIDQIKRMNLPLAQVVAGGALWLSGQRTPIRLADANTTYEVAEFPGALFLSHGFADSVVPVSSSDTLVGRRTHITEYLRTEADHIQSWKQYPARYDAALTSFLSTLGPAQ